MKKIFALLSLTLLAGSASRAVVARPALPQAAEKKQPQWKSNDEYNAYTALAGEKDPNKKISLAQGFLQKFDNSDFKDLTYLQMMAAYQQLGDSAQAVEVAQKGLEANPDNLDILTMEAYLFPFAFKATDADASAKLSRADSDAKHGLEILQKLQKPPNVAEDQFNQAVKARRAVFNGAVGFAALQRKDYSAVIMSLKAAAEDNPSDVYTFYRLGLAYLYSPTPDFDNAIWNLARSVALAKAAKTSDAAGLEKFYSQVYIGRHGSDQGAADVVNQAAASVSPPEGFKVAQAEKHKPTGNAAVDAFYNMEDTLRVGGDQANQAWDQIKGQPYGYGGQVDGVEKGSDADSTVVHIDITDESKGKDGVYDIALRTKQPDAKYLSKGDLVRFQGAIAAYTAAPSFSLTLEGTVNDDDLTAAAEKAKSKAKPKPRPATRRRTRG